MIYWVDKAELDYLNALPTSFSPPAEAVDRLRAAAAKIVLDSPDLQHLLNHAGIRIVTSPPEPFRPLTMMPVPDRPRRQTRSIKKALL
jgi:hypothetical protein